MSLEQFLESLTGDSTDLSQSDFIEISDLMPDELGQFVRTWFTIPVERKRWTVSTMVELAEDSPELDFSAVFKLCLREQDDEVLEKAIEGLWEHEDRSVITGLINVLNSNKSPRSGPPPPWHWASSPCWSRKVKSWPRTGTPSSIA